LVYVIGERIGLIIDDTLDKLDAMCIGDQRRFSDRLLAMVGAEDGSVSQEELDEIHLGIDEMREAVGSFLDCKETGSINENGYETVIAGKLLDAWASRVNDPAAAAARWTWTGTPAGISVPFDGIHGLYPASDKSARGSADRRHRICQLLWYGRGRRRLESIEGLQGRRLHQNVRDLSGV
jgi:hypothetical protein